MALASNASGPSTRIDSSAFRRVPPLAPRAAAAPAPRGSNRVERARRVNLFRRKVDSDARRRGRAAHLARAAAASSDDATPPAAASMAAAPSAGWRDEYASERDASASWDEDPAIDLEMSPAEDDAPDAWWVSLMNEGLDTDPGWTLAAFFMCDLGSAMVLFALYTVAQVSVDADFVLAYALAKGPLRAPRLALDAVVAADMTRRWPQLARVRVTSLIDAGTDALARFKRVWRSDAEESSAGGTAGSSAGVTHETGAESSKKSGAGAKLAAEARSLTDKYGLAYMAAKNIIGPVTMVIFYVALKSGIDVQALLERALGSAVNTSGAGGAAATAGAAAGRVCLSSFTSTALFPWVVLGAGALGPVLGRAARGLSKAE